MRPQRRVVEPFGHRRELRDACAKVGAPLGDCSAAVGAGPHHSRHVIDAVERHVASNHDSAEKAARDRLVLGIDPHMVEKRGTRSSICR